MHRCYRLAGGLVGVVLALCSIAPRASAETVVEAWRSAFGTPWSVSVNASDGSCWAATGRSVMHVAADGTVLSQTNGFTPGATVSADSGNGSCWVGNPHRLVHLSESGAEVWESAAFQRLESVSANPSDGSCWVADAGAGQVVHLSAAGAELWRGQPAGSSSVPVLIATNSADGSCWVGDSGYSELVHVAPSGAVLWQGGMYHDLKSLSVNSADGSCWIVDSNVVAHVSASGTELWRDTFLSPRVVSVNPTDGSCWVAAEGFNGGGIYHLRSDGEPLAAESMFPYPPRSLAVDPGDGSCWVADESDGKVVHLSATTETLWSGGGAGGGGFSEPAGVAVDVTDGSCWVADGGTWMGGVAHLSATGEWLWGGSWRTPVAVAVSNADGSCWVADRPGQEVVRLAADGSVLVRVATSVTGEPVQPDTVSVDPATGSCWVGGQVVPAEGTSGPWYAITFHIGANGELLWRSTSGQFSNQTITSVSVDPRDGSCWVADEGARHDAIWDNGEVVHLSATGTELWRGGNFAHPSSVSVNSTDGSCWVADGSEVIHLASSGLELWRGEVGAKPEQVSVNAVDGSCWVADANPNYADGNLVHLAADGTVLWSGEQGAEVSSVAVNPTDGSCWAADGSQVVHLVPVDFTDVSTGHWAFSEIEACYHAGIVSGYSNGSYRPTVAVTRDQMAAYMARALAHGDDLVPDGPVTPSFTDVPTDHWAYNYVEYCVDQGVVQGYWDGYRPEEVVNRGQMAVYIARAIATPTGEAGVPPATTVTFPDVTADNEWAWCYKHVEYIAGLDIVQGYWDGYHPEREVTRDQMAVYVARAFQLPM